MSMELLPSSQGYGRTVLILTGSNKRGHLLGYFIISLFICMWALQEGSNLPPEADGWREATKAVCFLGQGPGRVLCRVRSWAGMILMGLSQFYIPVVLWSGCPHEQPLWLHSKLMLHIMCNSVSESQKSNKVGQEISQGGHCTGQRWGQWVPLAICCLQPSEVEGAQQ